MPDGFVLRTLDRILKPGKWYHYGVISIDGYCLIATKDDQKNAGLPKEDCMGNGQRSALRERRFGLNPIKPYRDYYGHFLLQTELVKQELDVMFALGYTIQSKVSTVDDYSKFSWLRLATGVEGILYPNLSHQKQLLLYLLKHSGYPKFVVTRIYHYLQIDLYRLLAGMIIENERRLINESLS